MAMTFEQRIRKRRIWAGITALIAFVVLTILSAILFTALLLAFPSIDSRTWTVILMVCAVNVFAAAGIGWAARGVMVESVDLQTRDWGPMQRRLFAAAIQQEEEPAILEMHDLTPRLKGAAQR